MSVSKTVDICFAVLQQLSKPEILNSSKYLLCFILTLVSTCMLLSCSDLLTKFIAWETASTRSQILFNFNSGQNSEIHPGDGSGSQFRSMRNPSSLWGRLLPGLPPAWVKPGCSQFSHHTSGCPMLVLPSADQLLQVHIACPITGAGGDGVRMF